MPCLARLSGHFVTRRALFATHRGISVIFSFITPWDTIARGIEPEMPLIARRSAHFVTRRPISCPVGLFLPTGVFWSFFRALPRACICTWHRSQSAQHARVGHARALPRQPAWLPLAWQGGRPPPLIYASLAFPHVAGRNIFSSEERTSHFFEKLIFSQQSANWNLFKTFCSTFTKKFRFFYQRDYLLLINFEKQP
jgi:hypothetical protein